MKFRLIATFVLVLVLFICYVGAQNMSDEENQGPADQPSEQSGGYGGLGGK